MGLLGFLTSRGKEKPRFRFLHDGVFQKALSITQLRGNADVPFMALAFLTPDGCMEKPTYFLPHAFTENRSRYLQN